MPGDSKCGDPGTSEAAALDDDAEIAGLAELSTFDYERARKSAAQKLGVRAPMLDRLVAAKRSELGRRHQRGRQAGTADAL